MSVTTLKTKPYVLIDSGRITGGDSAHLIGRWCFMVSFVDEDGTQLHDYIGESYAEAGEVAIGWARDFGCKIIYRSEEDPTNPTSGSIV